MNTESLNKAKAWAENQYFSKESRNEIEQLIEQNNTEEITERFYKDLEFGTGGMRSIIGEGLNRINYYTIRKASQAVAEEVLAQKADTPKIAISYDSRRLSFEFAKEAASVFAANGIMAFIYERLNPVALLSFSVRHHKAQAGIMVTASHNPPAYNGYKVFWADGAQVTPPNDKNIIERYNNISEISEKFIKYISFEEGVEKGLIKWVGQDVERLYFDAIKTKAINPKLCQEKGNNLKVVYTAIHGTGLTPCITALNDLGINNVEVVKEQAEPDENFPTVKSPNPENPDALEMAVNLMKKTNADLALGTDPDTDRVGIALLKNGETVYLNGNQIGVLLLHYILTNLKEQNNIPENPYFVKTIVTTPLQDTIAKSFGIDVENTLTGFKWICGRMNEIEQKNPERNFIFATEESFGYLNHEYVRDKDGVSSITLICEMALWYKEQGIDLIDGLDKIYEQYGFSHETLLCLDYEGKVGSEKIARIMESWRTYNENDLLGNELDSFEDYQTSQIRYFDERENSTILLPKTNALGLIFKNGDRLFLRPSGTEPKIKFYIMICENEGSLEEKKSKALNKTDKLLAFIKEEASKI